MGSFIDPKLASLVPYEPGEQPSGIENLIKLNTNESPFPPSPKVFDAICDAEIEKLRLYPDPTCKSLTEALAERYRIMPSQVFLGNGSDEILAFCFHGVCPKGAVFADITYGFYPVYAQMFGVDYVTIPLRSDYSICIDNYNGIDRTVFVANPNAPTGICLSVAQIEELLCQDRERLVVIDEAYIDFGGGSAIDLTARYNNLLVVQTFSKSRQMAGARLGFAIGNSQIIADLNTMKFSFNPYNINRLTLIAAEASLKDEEYFQNCRKNIIENRKTTVAALKKLGFIIAESQANFIFVKPQPLTGLEYYSKLRNAGILVRYFDKDRLKDYVRITIGTAEQMKKLIAVTDIILKERA